MIKLIDPLKNKEDEAKMYLIAEMAGKFVAKFIYTARINGVPEVMLPIIANTLSQNIIGTLWADPTSLRTVPDQKSQLEEFDPTGLVPN